MTSATLRCATVEDTAEVARELARCVAPGQLVVLAGGLGAGKTTFTKAYAAALGVVTPVTSPSYTLAHHYRCAATCPVPVLVHADLWRLGGEAELADLALDEALSEGAAAIVEWGDRFDEQLPGAHVVVTFAVDDDGARELTVDTDGIGRDARALDWRVRGA